MGSIEPSRTYKTVEADPVWVRLPTGRALHFEGVEIGLLLSILRAKLGDSIVKLVAYSPAIVMHIGAVRGSSENQCRQNGKAWKKEKCIIMFNPVSKHSYPVSSAARIRDSIMFARCLFSCNAWRAVEDLDNCLCGESFPQ
jgi:hypothetical protein